MAWGRRVASMHGARVVLVHAAGGVADRGLTPSEAAKAMDGLASPMRSEGVVAEVELVDGDPATVIPSATARLKADLLVLGSRGQGALKRLLLGSVADAVLRASQVPVLVVHPADGQRPVRLATGLAGVDFSPLAHRATEQALRLAAPEHDARLLLLAATQLPIAFVGAEAPAMPLVETSEVDEPARENIRRWVKELGGRGVSLEGLVCPGAPGETILDTARERNVDFIAMGSEPRSSAARMLLGSIAMDVVHHAPCPVLVCR